MGLLINSRGHVDNLHLFFLISFVTVFVLG